MKTISVRLISQLLALVVGGFLGLVLWFGGLWSPHWVAAAVVVVMGVYYFSLWLINTLINSRIRPLYQSIVSKSRPKGALRNSDKSIALLEGEIRTWAERSQQELQLLHTMESYRKEFLGNVSHELKTPLFSLRGFIDTLQEVGAGDPKLMSNYLERCDKNIERLINIVHDLEEISRLESDTLILYRTRFDFNGLLREVCEGLELIFEKHNVTGPVVPVVPVYVMADSARIEQVVINLLSNATKYNRDGGSIKVLVRDMFDKVMIEVADTGVGIAAEDLPRIFERFYRIDKGRSRATGGTGLGLAIVKHIIEAHGETITVQSVCGQGTSFFLTLPKG